MIGYQLVEIKVSFQRRKSIEARGCIFLFLAGKKGNGKKTFYTNTRCVYYWSKTIQGLILLLVFTKDVPGYLGSV